MGAMVKVLDGLRNFASGLGMPGQDKQASAAFVLEALGRQEIDACYRGTWLGRKIHDIPAKDMTREWRAWQAEDNEIEAIEKEEQRLQLQLKVRRARTLASLYGGAALVLGLPGSPETPAPAVIRKGALQYVHVMHRHQLTLGDEVRDPAEPLFGQPQHFQLDYPDGRVAAKVHPSRVVCFKGNELPDGAMGGDAYAWFWGDPLLLAVRDALAAHDTTTGSIAALMNEAKVDVIHIPGLMNSMSSSEYERKLLERFTLANYIKSITNALLLDGGDGGEGTGETWETRQMKFEGLPDVQRTMFQLVAGAADIPATRLIGQAPVGMNATGESDTRNYYDMLSSLQESDLRPVLAPVDEWLIMSATGRRDQSIYYEWNPLWQMTPTEKADRDKKVAETAQIYANMGAVPDDAMSVAVQNRLIEDAVFPGLEAALEEAQLQATMEVDPAELAAAAGLPAPNTQPAPNGPPQPANDPNNPPVMAGNSRRRAANDRARQFVRDASRVYSVGKGGPEVLLLTDAVPKPLYVSRKVLNADEVLRWAKDQGLQALVPADSMHVTIIASREPVDWLKMGEPGWSGPDGDGTLQVSPGGPRVVEPLGDGIVLLFNSWELSYRHGAMREAGASWDFSEYQPHVTLSYDAAENRDVDLSAVVPFSGALKLGPEVFEPFTDGRRPSESE